MLYVHGKYRFGAKRTAFRNEYCLTCDEARRSVRIRTFDVLHICWIPVVPLGFWSRWYCTICRRRPGFNPRSRRQFLLALALLGAFSAGIFWLLSMNSDPGDPWSLFAIGGGAVAVVCFLLWVWQPRDPSLRERLARVPPANDTDCPYCNSPLDWSSWQCPRCGIARK